MKKKIFLISFMIVMLLSVFAISAFAEEIIVSKTESEEYGTIIQLNADPGLDNAKQYVSNLKKISDIGTDKDALCILTDGNTDNPSYYVFPSSYVVNEREDGVFDLTAGDLVTAMAEFNLANETDYYADYTITGSGASKRLGAIARFEFTSDVISVSDTVCCLRAYPHLVEARFDYEINLSAGDLFKGSNKLVTVVGFENADATIGHATFLGCTSLESVSLPTDITRISTSMFWGCKKIVISNLAECTQLTTIGKSAFQDTSYLNFVLPDSVTTIEANAFQSAFKEGGGGSFVINKTSQLTTIGNSAFEDCRKMPANVYIPSTVTSIGTCAFMKCYTLQTLENFENCKITEIKDGTFQYVTALKTLKIPETVTTIGTAFADNNNLTLVYIPKSVTSIADTFTGGKPTNAVYIYTGDDESVLSACTKLSGATVIPASEYNSENSYSGLNLIVGYSHCVAYKNGVHGVGVTDIVFKSFVEAIQKVNTCNDCGMKEVVAEIPELFACLGYSASQSGKGGIVIGFRVNGTAIAEYEELTNKTISYGAFVASKDRLNGGNVFENGEANSCAIVAEMAKYETSAFEIKIVGFETESQKKAQVAMGAYVAVTYGGRTEYSYLQRSEPDANEKYCFDSYNDVIELLSGKA